MVDLVDIGLNLAHDSFDADREEVLTRAAHAGVSRCIVTGTTVEMSRAAIALARSRPGVLFATAGVHPHHAAELDPDSLDALRELLGDPAVVASGECGLDFYRNFAPPAAQEHAFTAQLELAADAHKPVFLHQRDAHERFLALLAPRRASLAGGVAHCFTGGPEELAACLSLDLYVGVTGWICDPVRGAALRRAAPLIPLDRLLIETDAPYLLPKDIEPKPRGRRNEPSFLPHVLERLATLRAEPLDVLARATVANSERLFSLPRA
ncbi:MAG TPA: TatD family hydrolase [Gammaproteobacteria bacterium]|nr:TatD family hydrolase [Gammaproteobacteria bacterium]